MATTHRSLSAPGDRRFSPTVYAFIAGCVSTLLWVCLAMLVMYG